MVAILLTCCPVSIQKRKTHYSFGVLVWCLLYSRHVRFTQKEPINNHEVSVDGLGRMTLVKVYANADILIPDIGMSMHRFGSTQRPHMPRWCLDMHDFLQFPGNTGLDPVLTMEAPLRWSADCLAEWLTTHQQQTEDAVIGDKESNGRTENAIMQIRGILRTITCHIESKTQEPLDDESHTLPWLVERARCILSRCDMGRDGTTPFEKTS